MEIKASYFFALFTLVYFSVGMFIIYFFRKKYIGKIGIRGYKFPAIIYFISVPIIIMIGRDFQYDGDAILNFTPSLDLQFTIGIFIFAVIPTLVYLGVGIYILSLEHIKKKKGYKGPAIIYFISVPTLILIAITIHFMMNYTTGRFEATNKPAGYELYKFLVLKDIIPRSGKSLDEDKTTEYTVKVTKTETTQTVEKPEGKEIKISTVSKEDFSSKSLEEIKANLKSDGPAFTLNLGNLENGVKNLYVEIIKKESEILTYYYFVFGDESDTYNVKFQITEFKNYPKYRKISIVNDQEDMKLYFNIPKNIEEFEKYGNNTNVVTYFNKLSSWRVEYSYDNNYIKFQDYNSPH